MVGASGLLYHVHPKLVPSSSLIEAPINLLCTRSRKWPTSRLERPAYASGAVCQSSPQKPGASRVSINRVKHLLYTQRRTCCQCGFVWHGSSKLETSSGCSNEPRVYCVPVPANYSPTELNIPQVCEFLWILLAMQPMLQTLINIPKEVCVWSKKCAILWNMGK